MFQQQQQKPYITRYSPLRTLGRAPEIAYNTE